MKPGHFIPKSNLLFIWTLTYLNLDLESRSFSRSKWLPRFKMKEEKRKGRGWRKQFLHFLSLNNLLKKREMGRRKNSFYISFPTQALNHLTIRNLLSVEWRRDSCVEKKIVKGGESYRRCDRKGRRKRREETGRLDNWSRSTLREIFARESATSPPIRSTRCSSRTRNYPSLLYPRRRILCISGDGRGGGGGWMLKLINELGTKKINRTFRHEITCSISYIYVSWLTSLTPLNACTR